MAIFTAIATSSGPAFGTVSMTLPVAGLTISMTVLSQASAGLPPMDIFTVSLLRWDEGYLPKAVNESISPPQVLLPSSS